MSDISERDRLKDKIRERERQWGERERCEEGKGWKVRHGEKDGPREEHRLTETEMDTDKGKKKTGRERQGKRDRARETNRTAEGEIKM